MQCTVVEKGHINAGASGSNHGLLHSGARYVSHDPETARECRVEARLLKQFAPICCEDTGGLFVAVEGDGENYVADFPGLCEQSGISAQAVDCREARELEPELTDKIIAAYRVDDATIDPFLLSFDTMADAMAHGAVVMTWTQVTGMELRGGRIRSVRVHRVRTGEEIAIEADQIVNAGGAWVGGIAGMAGLELPAVWSKGSVLITQQRLTELVVNRLRPPADGDIVVPGGDGFPGGNDLGSRGRDRSPAYRIFRSGLPRKRGRGNGSRDAKCSIDKGIFRRSAPDLAVDLGRRPYRQSQLGNPRSRAGRLEQLHNGGGRKTDHLPADGRKSSGLGFARRLGVSATCVTGSMPLPNAAVNDWVVAGMAPGLWRRQKSHDDALLCECEMVPASGFARIVDQPPGRRADRRSGCPYGCAAAWEKDPARERFLRTADHRVPLRAGCFRKGTGHRRPEGFPGSEMEGTAAGALGSADGSGTTPGSHTLRVVRFGDDALNRVEDRAF